MYEDFIKIGCLAGSCIMLLGFLKKYKKCIKSKYQRIYQSTAESFYLHCVYCNKGNHYSVTHCNIDSGEISMHCPDCFRGIMIDVNNK